MKNLFFCVIVLSSIILFSDKGSISEVKANEIETSPRIPIEYFSQLPSVDKFSISPSGNKIVYIRNTAEKGISFIVMIDIKAGEKRVLGLTDNHGEHFRWLKWANEDIVLGSVRVQTNRGTHRLHETRLYKFYADGKRKSGSVYSNRVFKISRRKWNPKYQDKIIDWLPEDLDHVLVEMNIHESRYPSVFRLNVNDGAVRTIKKPAHKIYHWMTDQQHEVRLGLATDKKAKRKKVWLRNKDDNDWELVWNYLQGTIDAVYPRGFGLDGNILYLTKYHEGRLALFTRDLTTNKEMLVYADPVYDVEGGLIYSPKTHDVVGFYHNALPSGRYYLDAEYQKEQKKINAVLNKTTNYLVSISEDLDSYIIYADADTVPGTYYLGKKKTNALSALFSTFPNLKTEQMVGAELVSYTSRDGVEIEAYLSRPKGVTEPVATVIYPHGGPGARDYGYFDEWTEFLVSRGYAVLRPNFRGSSGYGFKFAEAQKGAWGMAMQDDVSDGVKWMVDQKITDPDKVCIFGASYGGYAALMGAVKTPDLFRCAISFAGVTDLVAIRNSYRRTSIYNRVKEQLGDDETKMELNSPRYRAAEIKIPVLLMHGEDDKTVEVEHSQWMADELKSAKKKYTYIKLPDGDHHLSIQSNRTKVFKQLGMFLSEYLD